jgi:hypothetical protein
MTNLLHQLFLFLLISTFIQFTAMSVTAILQTAEERLRGLFSKGLQFRIFRYCLVFYLIVLLLSKSDYIPLSTFATDYLSAYPIHMWNIKSLLWYLLLFFGVYSFLYILFNHKIRKNLSSFSYKKVPNGRGYKEFILSSLLFNVFTLGVLALSFLTVFNVNLWFAEHQMYLLDWLCFDQKNQTDFRKGFYFSFMLSVFLAIIFLNAIVKFSVKSYHSSSKFKFYLLSIVIFFTFLSGFYSIFNSIYSLNSNTKLLDWYQTDIQLGVFALRLASLILFFHIASYIIKNVLKSNVLEVALRGILPHQVADIKPTALSDRVYSTTFIAQIGFYVINVSIAEFSLIFEEKSLFRALLNFALAFIVDDYVIIHDYSNSMNKVLSSHIRRVDFFNMILLIGGCATLISLKFYFFTILYLLVTLFLARYYYTNQNRSIEV